MIPTTAACKTITIIPMHLSSKMESWILHSNTRATSLLIRRIITAMEVLQNNMKIANYPKNNNSNKSIIRSNSNTRISCLSSQLCRQLIQEVCLETWELIWVKWRILITNRSKRQHMPKLSSIIKHSNKISILFTHLTI